MRFECTRRHEGGVDVPVLVYRPAQPLLAISSGPFGGGIGVRNWVVNASVPMDYDRDDPDVHLAGIADALGLAGPGIGFLTGVDVERYTSAADRGVDVVATVGLGAPTWASTPSEESACGEESASSQASAPADDPTPHRPGTVNIVVRVPVRLGEAALVNSVATATEAKAQALWELGVAATGTATDAVGVLCVTDGTTERYAGPRSEWGARIARAVHAAVLAGGRDWLAAGRSWSDRQVVDRPSEPA